MKKLYALLFSIGIISTASATVVNVQATPNLVFTPDTVTINVGDTVRWTNTGGSHNVNGTMQTFPSNPEGFGNSVGSGWVYEFQFTIAGAYDYQCDPHASLGMTGHVIVQQSNNIDENQVNPLKLTLYPIPARTEITINTSGLASNAALDLITLDGKLISHSTVTNGMNSLSLADLPQGVYFARLRDGKRVVTKRFIVAR